LPPAHAKVRCRAPSGTRFSCQTIEEDHQLAKQAARLGSGQVTTWTSWHRWTAISLLAYAFLAVAAALQRTRDGSAGTLGLIPSPSLNC